jgi:uncharacterized protein YdeI (YjbR/CyaY-like superfamily)
MCATLAEPLHFFVSPDELRRWFDANHATERELVVGYHKAASGRASLTWSQSVDEALCVGWIDGVRRSLGAHAYSIRFTPRKPRSVWSAVNIRKVAALKKQGRMREAGLKAFARRDAKRSRVYSFEQKDPGLSADCVSALRKNAAAWEYFSARPPYYRRAAAWWVMSAKREETRAKRLKTLVADCAAGVHIKPLRRSGA